MLFFQLKQKKTSTMNGFVRFAFLLIVMTSYYGIDAMPSRSSESNEADVSLQIQSGRGTRIGQSNRRDCRRCMCSVGRCPPVLSSQCQSAGSMCCCCMPETHQCMDMNQFFRRDSHDTDSMDSLEAESDSDSDESRY